MTLRSIITGCGLIVFIACNNDASKENKADSAVQVRDSNGSNWPKPHDIFGGDTIPSPETKADTSHSTPKK